MSHKIFRSILLVAATVLLAPKIETVVTQIAVVSYCLPVVAVGGIAEYQFASISTVWRVSSK